MKSINSIRAAMSRRSVLRLLPLGVAVPSLGSCGESGAMGNVFTSGCSMSNDSNSGSDTLPFLLDLRSINGDRITSVDDGDGGESALYEWTTWLRIRSDVSGFVAPAVDEDDEFTGFVPPVFEDDGIAVLIHARDQVDMSDKAVGLHHVRLELAELQAIRKAVASIDWPRLPRPIGGDYSSPTIQLRYASGRSLIERSFSAGSGNFLEAISPLWKLLDKLLSRAMSGPSGTVEPILEAVRDDHDPRHFKLRVGLRNRSIGPVALNDPRLPTDSDSPRLSIQTSDSPYEWTTLELPPLPEDAPRSLLLAPRKRWEIELPFMIPKPGRYEVRMRWRDYGGPIDPLPGQVPFMPVPSTGRSFVGSGPYPVRGSCRSALRFEVGE
jgi:hypothetical protein